MERRKFIKIACGFVGAWPLAAEAQQPGNQRLIGVLGADATVWAPWTVALTARLRELGWSEGETVATEYRWAHGRSDRVSEFGAEFERRKVDVIVTYGSAATILRQTITTIPIVFAVAFDPVRSGLVQSLAHPAGNVTGVSIQQPDLVGKRLELLLSPSFIDWPSWLTLAMPSQCWRPIGLSPWLKHLGSKQRGSVSGVPKTLHQHSSRSRTKRTRFTSSLMRSLPPTAPVSSRSRSAGAYRQL